MDGRLERVKKALHLQWGELAKALDVSRSMLDQVRAGKKSFGPKNVRRLIDLEHEAGLEVEPKRNIVPEQRSNGYKEGINRKAVVGALKKANEAILDAIRLLEE